MCLNLFLKCSHEKVDEGVAVVVPRIRVDRKEVVVDEVVASQRHHIARLPEEIVGRLDTDLSPYQLLRPLK